MTKPKTLKAIRAQPHFLDREKSFCKLFVDLLNLEPDEKYTQVLPYYELMEASNLSNRLFKPPAGLEHINSYKRGHQPFSKTQVPMDLFVYKLFQSSSAHQLKKQIKEIYHSGYISDQQSRIKFLLEFHHNHSPPPGDGADIIFSKFFEFYLNTEIKTIKEIDFKSWVRHIESNPESLDKTSPFYSSESSESSEESLWTYYLMHVLRQPIYYRPTFIGFDTLEKPPTIAPMAYRYFHELKNAKPSKDSKDSNPSKLPPTEPYTLKFFKNKNKDGLNELKKINKLTREETTLLKIPEDLKAPMCCQSTLVKYIKLADKKNLLWMLQFPPPTKNLHEADMINLCQNAKKISTS